MNLHSLTKLLVFALIGASLTTCHAEVADSNFNKLRPVKVELIDLQKDNNGPGHGVTVSVLTYRDAETSDVFWLCNSRAFFDNTAASLACANFNQLGGGIRLDALATNTTLVRSSSPKKRGSLPYFSCKGSEEVPQARAFNSCMAGTFIPSTDCPLEDVVILKCYGEKSLRLVDGANANEGRLQMFYEDTWYNVCSDNIAKNATGDTACSMIMGTPATAIRKSPADFDPKGDRRSKPALLTPWISCRGDEEFFLDCYKGGLPYKEDAVGKCYGPGSDAAMQCVVKGTAPPPPPPNAAVGPVASLAGLLVLAAAVAVAMV